MLPVYGTTLQFSFDNSNSAFKMLQSNNLIGAN